jgi:tripartite ATP-independent transporter DctP family solute receptor
MSKFRLFSVLLSAAILLIASPASAQDYSKLPEMTIKMAHMAVPASEDNPYQMMCEYMKKYLEEKTGGRLKVELFHSGQLGRDRELMEAIQYGTLELAVITSSPISNFVPAHTIFDYPFLFESWDHVERFLASPIIEDFKAESQKARFHTLGVIPRGYRSVTNNKVKIFKPEDMVAVKLRVIESPIFIDAFTALGVSAQGMSWGEVFTALQQGTIDGQENPLSTTFDERVYEVQKYLSLTNHIFSVCEVVASPPLFDKMPKDYQDLIRAATNEAIPMIAKRQRAEELGYAKKLADKGMEVNEIESIQPFQDKMVKVWEKYNKNADIKKYFDAIQAVR